MGVTATTAGHVAQPGASVTTQLASVAQLSERDVEAAEAYLQQLQSRTAATAASASSSASSAAAHSARADEEDNSRDEHGLLIAGPPAFLEGQHARLCAETTYGCVSI